MAQNAIEELYGIEKGSFNTLLGSIEMEKPAGAPRCFVVGGGGFFAGILQTTVRPGFYAKTGLNFEFAKNDYRIRALEIGALFDMVFPFIQQMAHNPAKPCYVAGYIAFDFGRKKGVH